MSATTSVSLPPPPLLFCSKPRPPLSRLFPTPPCVSPLSLSTPNISIAQKSSFFSQKSRRLKTPIWRTLAAEEALPSSDTVPVDSSQQIVSGASDDGVGNIVSGLLFVAFIALSVLTFGVIYIAVTDFLRKREREKFEKEEAAKKKGGKNKKAKVRTRAGPRGFGQKVYEEDDDDDN